MLGSTRDRSHRGDAELIFEGLHVFVIDGGRPFENLEEVVGELEDVVY